MLIRHIVDFKKLNLIWLGRFVVAKIIKKNNDVQLRYLKSTRNYTEALTSGFKGYPAFNIENEVHSSGVLEAFQRRLPPRKREDFGKYLEMFRLPHDAEISDFGLLGYSGAKLPGDAFSIIPSFEEILGPYEFLMEVAGFRHNSKISIENIELNAVVTFEEEQNNQSDPGGIDILFRGKKIGYVIKPLLQNFHEWLKSNRISNAMIARKSTRSLHVLIQII